jgi:hypothetical protein
MAALTPMVPPPGEAVMLSDKKRPICESLDEQYGPLCITRAKVDVSAFKQFLHSLPPETWEDEGAGSTNVQLMRPAHDKWGIKKIIFTFCDDFMLKVLDLPWYVNSNVHAATLDIPLFTHITFLLHEYFC